LSVVIAAILFWPRDLTRQKEEALARGNRAFDSQRFLEAIGEYKSVVRIDPGFSLAHARLAESYARIGDSRNALAEWVVAADLQPVDVAAQLRAGNALLLLGRPTEAAQRAAKVLETNRDDLEARILLANATAGLSNLDDGVVQMYRLAETVAEKPREQARALLHAGVMELARDRLGDAERALNKARTGNSQSIDDHLSLAGYYWFVGRHDDAESELQRVLAQDSREPRANRALAALYISTNKIAEAETPLKTLAELATGGRTRLILADYYIVVNRLEEATATLSAVGNDAAFFAQSQSRLALIEYLAGRKQRAEEMLDGALRKEPTHPTLLLLKARLLAERRRFDDAIARVSAVLATDPKSAEAQYLLGTIHDAAHHSDDAITAFTQVVRLRPRLVDALLRLSGLYLARGDGNNASVFALQALKETPSRVDAHVALVRVLLARGSIAEAERELKPLLDATPVVPAVLTQWGRLLAAKRDLAGARAHLKEAIDRDPSAFEPLAELVEAEIGASRAADALPLVLQRLAGTPEDTALLMLAARIYGMTNDPTRTEATLQRVIQIEPSNLRALGALGQFYYATGKLADAQRQFTALSKQNSKSTGAWTMLGIAFELDGKIIEAKESYEHALAIDSHAAVAANNLAWLHLRRDGNADAALELAQRASAAFPNEPEFNDTLGWIYVKKNASELALEPLLDAVRAAPSNPLFHFHLGMAYTAQANFKLAKEHFERALSGGQAFEGRDEAIRELARVRKLTTDDVPATPPRESDRPVR